MIPDNVIVDPRYSSPGTAAPDWQDIAAELTGAEVYALTTVLPDSTPHTVPVAGIWTNVGFLFCTGEYEQKARIIATNSRASVHLGTSSFDSGRDIVVCGDVLHTTDEEILMLLVNGFEGKYPEPFRFDLADGAVLNAHGNRAEVYRIRTESVHVFTRGESTVQAKYMFETG